MHHKRIHIRVPVIGEATLTCENSVVIHARTIDISAGGLCVTDLSISLENTVYDVEVVTVDHGKVTFKAVYVQESEKGVGLKIEEIDVENLKSIYSMVADFQATEEFIDHIVEHDILKDWFLDDKGSELDVTFEVV